MFHEQAESLKDGGADVLWLANISLQEEHIDLAEAFAKVELRWCSTLSFDTAGRKMMGITSQNIVDLVQTQDKPPVAFGANWVRGASYLIHTLQGFATNKPTSSLIAKGNAGIPKHADWYINCDGKPHFFGRFRGDSTQ